MVNYDLGATRSTPCFGQTGPVPRAPDRRRSPNDENHGAGTSTLSGRFTFGPCWCTSGMGVLRAVQPLLVFQERLNSLKTPIPYVPLWSPNVQVSQPLLVFSTPYPTDPVVSMPTPTLQSKSNRHGRPVDPSNRLVERVG